MTFEEWKESLAFELSPGLERMTKLAYLEALKHAASVMCYGCRKGYSVVRLGGSSADYFHPAQSRCFASDIHKAIAAMTE